MHQFMLRTYLKIIGIGLVTSVPPANREGAETEEHYAGCQYAVSTACTSLGFWSIAWSQVMPPLLALN